MGTRPNNLLVKLGTIVVILILSLVIFCLPPESNWLCAGGWLGGLLFLATGIIWGDRQAFEIPVSFLVKVQRSLYSAIIFSVAATIFLVIVFYIFHLFLSSEIISLALPLSLLFTASVFVNYYVSRLLQMTPTGISPGLVLKSRASLRLWLFFVADWLILAWGISYFLRFYYPFQPAFLSIFRYCFIFGAFFLGLTLTWKFYPLPFSKISRKKTLSTAPQPSSPKAPTKLLLLGLDSADWRLLSPLLSQGKCPHLARLIASGAYGYLDCYGKRYSPVVWTTMVTGVTEEKHGICDFVFLEKGKNVAVPFKSFHRRVPALWNMASQLKKKCAIINWMVTYPAEEISGLMISDFRFLKRKDTPALVSPEKEQTRFLNCLDRIDFFQSQNESLPFEEKCLKKSCLELEALSEVLQEFFPDHLAEINAIYIHALDSIHHHFWQYYSPKDFSPSLWQYSPPAVKKYHQVIPDYWEKVDKFIGELLGKIDEETLVVIVSDHGSKPRTRPMIYLDVNALLARMGYLYYKNNFGEIDFSRTLAFWSSTVLWDSTVKITFNVRTRQSEGVVLPEELPFLRDQLIRELREISSRPIFTNYRLLTGQEADIICRPTLITKQFNPDFKLTIKGKTYLLNEFLRFVPGNSGNHDPRGLIILAHPHLVKKGPLGWSVLPNGLTTVLSYLNGYPGIRRTDRLFNLARWLGILDSATTLDVLPTILYLLGCPLPESLEGRVLEEAISRTFLRQQPLLEVSGDFYDYRPAKEKKDFDQEDKEIKDQLKALGYID